MLKAFACSLFALTSLGTSAQFFEGSLKIDSDFYVKGKREKHLIESGEYQGKFQIDISNRRKVRFHFENANGESQRFALKNEHKIRVKSGELVKLTPKGVNQDFGVEFTLIKDIQRVSDLIREKESCVYEDQDCVITGSGTDISYDCTSYTRVGEQKVAYYKTEVDQKLTARIISKTGDALGSFDHKRQYASKEYKKVGGCY